jgi:quinol monooxygenase YgiN
MLNVFARAVSKPGQEESLRSTLRELGRRSRMESGVRYYEIFETQAGGEFLFREQYRDEEAFEAHKSSRHVRAAVARAVPMMEGDLTLWVADPLT